MIINPHQANAHTNHIGDACDLYPKTDSSTNNDMNCDVLGDVCDIDLDGDGEWNNTDNCPYALNMRSSMAPRSVWIIPATQKCALVG